MTSTLPQSPEIATDGRNAILGSDAEATRAQERASFLSLALQLRRNSHLQRRWAREAAERGQTAAVEGFTKTANRYASDALWYWRRARNT